MNAIGSPVGRRRISQPAAAVATARCRAVAMTTSAAAFLCLPLASLAQTPPDAGVLQQQIERERSMRLPPQGAPAPAVSPADMRPVEGMVVTIREFRLAGNTLLGSEELLPVLAPYLNRPLRFGDLQDAAAAVARRYREAGWIARAYLPEQDIKDGIIIIQIVEAVFGSLRHEGDESGRVSRALIEEIFQHQQAPGRALNADALDRALLLADDLPGVTVAGNLAQGRGPAQTDLILKAAGEPLLTGEAALDNTGTRSTGQERLTANLSLASPLRLGDQMTGNLIHSEGSDYGRIAYSLPVGADGWRIGINASELNYRLIQAPYHRDRDRGSSSSIGLDINYPLIRSRLSNLFVSASHERKHFDNRLAAAADGIASRYDMHLGTLALSGNLFDKLGGGGANSASLAVVVGRRDEGISVRAQNFSKLRYSLSRQQVITETLSLYAALAGQQASKNLDSSERFYLGGANGVRAYPASEAGGSSASLANLELRWRLPEGLSLAAFLDSGAVRNYENAGNNYSLSGGGLALGWQGQQGLNLKAVWASRIGRNPYPGDQNESVKPYRFWLTASLAF